MPSHKFSGKRKIGTRDPSIPSFLDLENHQHPRLSKASFHASTNQSPLTRLSLSLIYIPTSLKVKPRFPRNRSPEHRQKSNQSRFTPSADRSPENLSTKADRSPKSSGKSRSIENAGVRPLIIYRRYQLVDDVARQKM